MSNIANNLNSMSLERRIYTLQTLPAHLADAEMNDRLEQILSLFSFMQAKVDNLGVIPLINDYDLVKDNEPLQFIQGALQLSADILEEDKTQLAGHLTGRLLSFQESLISTLLEEIKQESDTPWLRPLSPSMLPPGQPLLRTLSEHTAAINVVAVAHTGNGRQIIISGSDDKTLKIWDFDSGRCLHTLIGHTSSVTGLAVTPDGRRAISSTGTQIKIWDLANGVCLYSLDNTGDEQQGSIKFGVSGPNPIVAITSNGNRAIFAATNTIKVWDLEKNECLNILTGHTDVVRSVAATPDGQMVVSSGEDGTLRFWDLAKGECFWVLKIAGFSPPPSFLIAHLSPDGSRVIVCTRNQWVMILDINKKTCVQAWRLPRQLYGLTVLPDGIHAFSYSGPALRLNRDPSFWLWNLETGEIQNRFLENLARINSVAIAANGCYAITASWALTIWDIRKHSRDYSSSGHSRKVNVITTMPGNYAISGAGSDWVNDDNIVSLFGQGTSTPDDNTIKIWNAETGQCVHTLVGHTKQVSSLKILSSRHILLSASKDKTIKIWDLISGECQHTLQTSGNAIALSPDGRQLIFDSEGNNLQTWSIERGKNEFTLTGHSHKINKLIITSDRQHAISASEDTTIRIWDLRRGKCLGILTHDTWVTEILVTPDGRYLISESYDDHPLKVWDLKKCKRLHALEGLTDSIGPMVVTPDGLHIIIGLHDNTIQIWEIATGRLLKSMEGHSDGIKIVTITPDNNYIISHSRDHTIKIWNSTTFSEECTLAADTDWIRVTQDANRVIYALDSSTLNIYDLKRRCSIGSFKTESQLSTCDIAEHRMTIIAGTESGRVHFLHMENIVSCYGPRSLIVIRPVVSE